MSNVLDLTGINGDADINLMLYDSQMKTLDEQRMGKELAGKLAAATLPLKDIKDDFDKWESTAKRHLTAEGYQHDVGVLRERLRERLDRVARPLTEELQARIVGLSSRLTPTPPDTAGKTALIIEYRARLRLRDPLDVQVIFWEACRTRDAVTIAAVQTAPLWDRLCSDEVLAKGREIIAEVEFPDVISALAETEKTAHALASAVRGVERHCGLAGDLVEITRDDATADAD